MPRGVDDWRLAVDIVSEFTESRGLGPIALDHELAGPDDRLEQFGDGEADDHWQWTGTAYGTSQWISIALTDVSKDESGDAAEERRDHGWPPQSIAISYGATTLPEGDRATFERRLALFAGLDVPTAITSD